MGLARNLALGKFQKFSWQWGQDLSLLLELASWSPFSWEGFLAHSRYSGEGLGPASKQSQESTKMTPLKTLSNSGEDA